MATMQRRERPTPYTPAGDLGGVLGDLEGVASGTAATEGDGERGGDADGEQGGDADGDGTIDGDEQQVVLPKLDTALEELAAAVDNHEARNDEESAVGGEPEDAARDDAKFLRITEESGLARERADFEEVAESTDVDAVPFDDAATFLANDLYTVPPANTRFQWLDGDDVLPAS